VEDKDLKYEDYLKQVQEKEREANKPKAKEKKEKNNLIIKKNR